MYKDKVIVGDFKAFNINLTSLEDGPKEVIGDFYCHYNQLTSLESAPDLKKNGGFIEDDVDIKVNYNVNAKEIIFE